MAKESKSGYIFTRNSSLSDVSKYTTRFVKFVLLKMFKSVNDGEYLFGYLFYNTFLYSLGDFKQGNEYSDHFTEQMGMFVNVVHSILNELVLAVELDLDTSASRMST